jgi:hypothetical protein
MPHPEGLAPLISVGAEVGGGEAAAAVVAIGVVATGVVASGVAGGAVVVVATVTVVGTAVVGGAVVGAAVVGAVVTGVLGTVVCTVTEAEVTIAVEVADVATVVAGPVVDAANTDDFDFGWSCTHSAPSAVRPRTAHMATRIPVRRPPLTMNRFLTPGTDERATCFAIRPTVLIASNRLNAH